MSQLTGTQLTELAAALDEQIAELVEATRLHFGLDADQDTAVKILLAGRIAGRAEQSVAGNENAQKLYDSARQQGHQMVTAINHPAGVN